MAHEHAVADPRRMSEREEPRPRAVRGCPRLRAYRRESHGIHRLDELGEETVAALPAWQLLTTNRACFTALTSAIVRDWWLPPIPDGTPVFMAMGVDDPRPMRQGVRTSRHEQAVELDEIDGLRCASVPETLLACARWLCLIDVVVLVDCVLSRQLCPIDQVKAVARPRRPGASRLLKALALADGRSESPYETLLRLLHVSCGAEVHPQFELRDDDGDVFGRADLWVVGTDSIHEFDGDEHEKAGRRVKDRRRDRRIDKAGMVRRGYTAGDLLQRPVTVLDDIDRALGRPHDPSRIRPWLDELRRSLFTAAGRSTFLEQVA